MASKPSNPAPTAPPWGAHRWFTSDAAALLPAFASLVVATGAAAYALAYYITVASFTQALYWSLAISLAIALAVRAGTPPVARAAGRCRAIIFALSIPVAIVFYDAILSWLQQDVENTAVVAVAVGWAMLLCVFATGLKIGHGRISWTAALVPGLSLFGLLNIVMVDTQIAIAFVIFIAASLYHVAYEAMLSHRVKADASLDASAGSGQAATAPGQARVDNSHELATPAGIARAAMQLLGATAIWLAAFLVVAAIVFYPLQAVLPAITAAPFSHVRGNTPESAFDWRTTSTVMELIGGHHDLSARPKLRVRIVHGQSDGLWRGHVFEVYTGSRWEDRTDQRWISLPLDPDKLTPLPTLWSAIDPRLAAKTICEADVTPLDYTGTAVYASGHPTALRGDWRQVNIDDAGSLTAPDTRRIVPPYQILTVVPELHLDKLLTAPGASSSQIRAWRANPGVHVLQLPDDIRVRSTLIAIARGLSAQALASGKPLRTPYEKVLAVENYLYRDCQYSLDAPLVPPDQDAVVNFLTVSHVGACDMFASSMALLLRTMNVPTRLATGYLQPEGDPTFDVATFTMRERDAHAWVEFHIPGVGWMPYDPSAGTRVAAPTLASKLAAFLQQLAARGIGRLLLLPLLGLILLFLGASRVALPFTKTPVRLSPEQANRKRVATAYWRARSWLGQRVPERPGLTPVEYENAVTESALPPHVKAEFCALTYLLLNVLYGGQAPTVTADRLRDSLKRLRGRP